MLIPKDAKDVAGLRNFLTAQRTQACALSQAYTGPLKQVFDDLIAKVDAFLAGLPSEDKCGDWTLANQLDCLFSYAAQCSACASQATLELSKLNSGQMSALNTEIQNRITAGTLFTKDNYQTAVDAAVKAKLDAGELVTKTRLDQMCSEVKGVAFEEGAKKAREEHAAEVALNETVGKRKALLQTASLPLPEADLEKIVLGATEEEFNARKAKFETRREDLKKQGIQLNSDAALANLWLEDKAYEGFKRTVESLPALKFTPNPLAGAGAGAGNAGSKSTPVLIV